MVDTLFWITIGGGLLWFVLTPHKGQSLQLITHASLQYLLSLLFWTDYLNTYFTGLLWAFLILTSLLLIWAPRIPFGRERYFMLMFFRVAQWAFLLGLIVFVAIKSPFFYQSPGLPSQSPLGQGILFMRPLVKVAGNLLTFTTFFHLILQGSQPWSIQKSLYDLLPIVIYMGMMGLFRYWQVSLGAIPLG